MFKDKNKMYVFLLKESSRTNDAYFFWILFFSKTTCPSLSSDIPTGKEAVYALSSAELIDCLSSMTVTEWDT